MDQYQPELGQMIFGQPHKQYAVSEIVEAALRSISNELERAMWNINQKEYSSPMDNSGNVGGFVCPTFEKTAYNTVVAAKAFTDKMKSLHPECASPTAISSGNVLCADLAKATAAKDALIDAIEVYCAGPNFNGGGACDPPAKGTPAATQATTKLQAAISAYTQTEVDLKGVIK